MDAKFFKTQAAFRAWLAKNHDKVLELWIGFYKKGSGLTAMTYAEALDEALCYGWVDGLKGTLDEEAYRIRFTPRKAKSVWSTVNIGHVARLIEEGKMMPSGHARVNEAKGDGRWDRSYAPSSTAVMPDDFLKALGKNKKAKAFYATLNKSKIYPMYYRIQNAKKPDTRQRWIDRIVLMLENEETFHMSLEKKND